MQKQYVFCYGTLEMFPILPAMYCAWNFSWASNSIDTGICILDQEGLILNSENSNPGREFGPKSSLYHNGLSKVVQLTLLRLHSK